MEAQAISEDRLYAIHTQKLEVLLERRQLFYLDGDIENGNADSLALLQLAREIPDDPDWLVQALLVQPEVTGGGSRNKDDLMKGLAMAEEALQLSQQLGDKYREMYSMGTLATIYSALGDARWGEYSSRGLEIARQLGDIRSEVRFLLGIGQTKWMDNRAVSRQYLEEALKRSEALNDKFTEMILLSALGQEHELRGDYYRHLTEFEQKRLQLCREIGDRLAEGQSLMFCGQIKAIYLGDYEPGLEMQFEALRRWEKSAAKIYPLLRIAQIQGYLGKHAEAMATLEEARPISKTTHESLAQAGFHLVTCILYNEVEEEAHLRMVFDHAYEVEKIVEQNLLSRQYAMVAACERANAHLKLSKKLTDRHERKLQARLALESSQKALVIYQEFGFTGAVECVAEEIFFRHSLALSLNSARAEAGKYLESAYNEMMRKLEMIPPESHYRNTFLNIGLHRQISRSYATMKKQVERKSVVKTT
jgi:tetratricopeptide (TPR) repeat protein